MRITESTETNKFIPEFVKITIMAIAKDMYANYKQGGYFGNVFLRTKKYIDDYKHLPNIYQFMAYEGSFLLTDKSSNSNGNYEKINKQINIFNFHPRDLDISNEYLDMMGESSIIDINQSLFRKIVSTLTHEVRHLYDDSVSNGKAFNNYISYSKNANNLESYINQDSELSAIFDQGLTNTTFYDHPKNGSLLLPWKEVKNSFINRISNWDNMNDQSKRKLITRLAKAYGEKKATNINESILLRFEDFSINENRKQNKINFGKVEFTYVISGNCWHIDRMYIPDEYRGQKLLKPGLQQLCALADENAIELTACIDPDDDNYDTTLMLRRVLGECGFEMQDIDGEFYPNDVVRFPNKSGQ